MTTQNLLRLFEGLVVSTEISFISIIISVIGGLILGVLMSMKNKFIYLVLKICLEIVRIMPQIVWLFLFYFGISKAFDIHISAFTASLIVFSLWGIFEMMDIVRGAITSIPKHQFESAASLGLSKFQIYFYVIIPLATRRLVPGAVNLLSRMIKNDLYRRANRRCRDGQGRPADHRAKCIYKSYGAILDIRAHILFILCDLLSSLKTIKKTRRKMELK